MRLHSAFNSQLSNAARLRYPVSGAPVQVLSRAEHRALRVLNEAREVLAIFALGGVGAVRDYAFRRNAGGWW